MYIQDIAKELNLSKKAINLYEEKGLIHPQKDNKGYRIYQEEEKQTLLKIKQLRKLDFHIEEIKAILIDQNYDIFEQKKAEYQIKLYQIYTSIQYIDSVKDMLLSNQNIEELAIEMNDVYSLEETLSTNSEEIDFDKIWFYLLLCAGLCAIKLEQNIIFEILACFFFLCSILIYSSSTVRVYFYKIYHYFKK